MRGPHVEFRRWTYKGKPRQSDWLYLVFYVRTPRGAQRNPAKTGETLRKRKGRGVAPASS